MVLALAVFLIASTLYDNSRPPRPLREAESVPVQAQPLERPREEPPRPEHGSIPAAEGNAGDDRPDVEEYMRDMLIWERPENRDGHWPPYRDFVSRDYDPNRWETFEE